MRKSLGTILRWVLLGVLFLGIPSALADPINQIAGGAALDQSSPRVWRHGTATTNLIPDALTTSSSQYLPMVYAVLGACESLATCTSIAPLTELEPASDALLASTNTLATSGLLYGFNGTTWDRIRVGAAGDTNVNLGKIAAGQYISDGSNWNPARQATGDALAAQGIPTSGGMVFNGTTWDRAREANADALGGAGGSTGIPAAGLMGFGTTNWNRLYTYTPTFATLATTGQFVLPQVSHSTWSVTHTPAAATQATASRAAGAAGVRHVATTVTACLAAGATAQTPILVNLRDGATGAGTILRSWAISAPVNDSKCADLSGLAMIGTAATAMTIEFAAAGVAASQQTVTLTGFSTLQN